MKNLKPADSRRQVRFSENFKTPPSVGVKAARAASKNTANKENPGISEAALAAALNEARRRVNDAKKASAALNPHKKTRQKSGDLRTAVEALRRAAAGKPAFKPDGRPVFKPAAQGMPFKKQFPGAASKPGNRELAGLEKARLKKLAKLKVTFVSNSRASALIKVLSENTPLADRSRTAMEFISGLKIKKARPGTFPIAINELKELFKNLKLNETQRTEVFRLYLIAARRALEKKRFLESAATPENFCHGFGLNNGWARQRNRKKSLGFLLKIKAELAKLNWIIFDTFTEAQAKTKKIWFRALNRWSYLSPERAVRLKKKSRAPPPLLDWLI